MTGKSKKEKQVNENTLTNEIADIVRERILKGEYEIGEKIKESSIAQELNVSRTPIREAFRMLEEEGLLDYLPNRGCYAKGFTKRDVSDIYTVREALEEIAMTWACERITDEEIERLSRFNPNLARMMRMNQVHSLLMLPLRRDEKILGFMYVINFNIDKTIEIKEMVELMAFSSVLRYSIIS
jgi:DNA-binding FadR family transcriptional regulator